MTSQSSALATTPASAGVQQLVKLSRKPASPPPGAVAHKLAPLRPAPPLVPRRPRGRPRKIPQPISATSPMAMAIDQEVRERTNQFVEDIAEVIRNAPPAEFLAWVGIDLRRLLSPAQRRTLALPPAR